MPPRRHEPLDNVVLTRIATSLATRFDVSKTVAKRHLDAATIEEWGRVCRTDGGDTMKTIAATRPSEDRRDATHVRVSIISHVNHCHSDRNLQSMSNSSTFTLT